MTTSNISISNSWTKVADTSNSDLLITWDNPVTLEIATTATDVAPTVNGHKVTCDSAITRGVLGTGYVWCKVLDKVPSQVTLIVSK